MPIPSRHAALDLTVDEPLAGVLALGLLEAEGLRPGPLPAEFLAERDRVVHRLVGSFTGKQPADIPGVAETRALFHALGVDPTKTRPSSEALLRRVLQGKGLPEIHPAVDVCNLASVEHQLPLGLYDRDQVHGGIVARLGRAGESYPGIRKRDVRLEDRLLLADDQGPFGAPTSDSARTAVGAGTTRLLVALFCPMDRAEPHLVGALEHLSDLLVRHCGATIVGARTAQ